MAQARGSLIEAMIWLCIVNTVTLIGYSWAVFKADGTPFFKGLYVSSRPMLMALVMALAVRYLLETFGSVMPNPVLQILAGAAIGGVIYGLLVLISERPLLAKIYQLVKNRRG